jgi:hypothetical protein
VSHRIFATRKSGARISRRYSPNSRCGSEAISTFRPRASGENAITAVPAPIDPVHRGGGARPDHDTDAAADLERLRTILLGDSLGTLDARVAGVERAEDELHARLPAAIERAGQGAGAERMATALATPVTQALGAAVRENRALIVDVLFPVIGPAIRKAIAESMRNLVADINRTMESSFTPRGLRWRIEAWRSGVPYAEVVLKQSLRYGVDHVFLIERDSGLVLARESAPHLPDLDADAIAGMLTAIGDFVHDSVGRGSGDTLDSARVGEHLLWVMHGPRANLACFIHGVPPARLRALLEQRLEAIHARAGSDEIAGDEATHASLRPEALVAELVASDRADAPAHSRWPARIALLAILVGVVAYIVHHQRGGAWLDRVRARLASHPGFVMTGIDRRDGATIVRGLLDPDADPPANALGEDASRIAFQTTGFVSADDAVVARRATRLLDAPHDVTLAVHGGVLSVAGDADSAWIETARQRAGWVPGVRHVDFAVGNRDDSAAAKNELFEIASTVPDKFVAFGRDTEPAPEATRVLDALVADTTRAAALGKRIGVDISWIAAGTNDDPGSDAANARVRADRAKWLADALRARGVANVAVAPETDLAARDVRQRGAFLRLAGTDFSR